MALGDAHRAIEFYEQALTIAREIGHRRGEGNALWAMSLALDKTDEHLQAVTHAKVALEIYFEIEDPTATRVREQLTRWLA